MTTMKRRTARLLSVSMAVALLGPTGCANLGAVRRFAKTSAATADYRQAVDDYVAAPARIKRFAPPDAAAGLDAQARARSGQRARLEAAQAMLVNYLGALGDLSADELADVDADVESLGDALEKGGLVGEGPGQLRADAASAAASIGKVLVRASLEGWRRREVVRIIREADPHLQAVVAGLAAIVEKDFALSLEQERQAVESVFRGWEAAARAGGDPDGAPRVARALLEERLVALQLRRAALTEYGKVLVLIGKGHADLRAKVDHLEGPDLRARLTSHARDLMTLYRSIRTLAS